MRTFFATLLLIPAVLAAQAPPEPSGARLRLGTDTLVSFLVRNGDTTAVGWVIDEISARELNGERVLFRVYRGNSQLSGSLLDTLVDVLESLQPRSHSSRSSRSFERVQFSAGRAVGRILQPTGDSIMVDVALPSPVYSSA